MGVTRSVGVIQDSRYREHRAPEGHPDRPDRLAAVEEAIAAGRQVITAATRHTVHTKTLAVVSDEQQRIMWAAASDGWETDYRPGSPPEMR